MRTAAAGRLPPSAGTVRTLPESRLLPALRCGEVPMTVSSLKPCVDTSTPQIRWLSASLMCVMLSMFVPLLS